MSLTIAADAVAFDTECLAAPAGQGITLKFDNRESLPHNVAIYGSASATDNLFKGEIVTGPKMVTYQIPALRTGGYFFRCDLHPDQMTGTFAVE